MLTTETVETTIGPVHLAVRDGALCGLRFDQPFAGTPGPTGLGERVRAYFAGDLRALDGIALDAAGTPFQKRVWAALLAIPAGQTRTYGELARALGTHPRAIGAANAANPVGVAIPCHRVIAKGGKLSGYAWGEERKRWLLAHERTHCPA
ncbi:MAG TPA: methylated-DNA--[protein]-cysteine S-methyltransferase [Myxococcales bacterium]|nr:methylated-DNA--[protein]-cysteine S-methyltransferase [Myxococcales bacterium]